MFSALNDACMEVSRWEGDPLGAEVAGRLRLWPDSGGWSLAELNQDGVDYIGPALRQMKGLSAQRPDPRQPSLFS